MTDTNGFGNGTAITQAKDLDMGQVRRKQEDVSDEIVKPKTIRKKYEAQNKQVTIHLDLDAGSSRAKFVIDGWLGSYPTMFKEVTGELPSGISGCFSIGSKNYAVGQVTNSLNGNLMEAFKDNKIKYLHVWLIGALSMHPDLLQDIDQGRKYKTKPARLKVVLRLLSLSSSKRNDITKILKDVKTFSREGCDFQVEISSDNYLYPEGYGAALEALQSIAEGITEFSILDLGGGTLTLSSYQVGRNPRAIEQTSGSGNGMKAIIERLSIALARIDVIKAIYVEDMASVETALHQQFKHCNIKLEKSREWHDFTPWQYAMVFWAFRRYESHRISFADIPKRTILGGLVALLGVGLLIGYSMKENVEPQAQHRIESK